MADFSVVLITVCEHGGCLDAFLASLAAQTIGVGRLTHWATVIDAPLIAS